MASASAMGAVKRPDVAVEADFVEARQHLTGIRATFRGLFGREIARVEELPRADAILFGTPTRFGNMCAQMRNFLDQTGKHWMSGALIGKIGPCAERL